MDRQAARQVRAARGTAAASVTTVLAATAHTIGGGSPSPLLVVIAIVLAAPVAVALIGRRVSLARTALAVVCAQAVFHIAFALFGAETSVSFTSTPGLFGHAAMHTAPVMRMAPGAASAAGWADGPMLLTHAVAALVTIVLLHRGERMLRALGRGILTLLRPAVGAPAPLRLVRRVAAAHREAPMLRSVPEHGLRRRGPPACCATA